MNLVRVFLSAFAALCLLGNSAAALTIGQVDDFEDGTVENWIVGVAGAPHPQPPENVASGGPAGADDNYLRLTSFGGQGAGSRLVVVNVAQWAGDYAGAGVNAIEMDLLNMGPNDLFIRLLLEDPMGGPPTNVAVSTSAFVLPSASNWTHAVLSLKPEDLTALIGSVNTVLSNATAVRIYSSPVAIFPPDPVIGLLGVDNIRALSVSTPAKAASWGRIKGLFR